MMDDDVMNRSEFQILTSLQLPGVLDIFPSSNSGLEELRLRRKTRAQLSPRRDAATCCDSEFMWIYWDWSEWGSLRFRWGDKMMTHGHTAKVSHDISDASKMHLFNSHS